MQPAEIFAMEKVQRQQIGVRTFKFGTATVRIVSDGSGELWFVARDVAEILGYIRPENAIPIHCKSHKKINLGYSSNQGGTPLVTVIPERDVYRLIMRSKLPAAERFEEWVVGEVLPSIRKTGSYSVNHVSRRDLAQMVLAAEAELDAANETIAELAPKAAGFDIMLTAGNFHTLKDTAKFLNTGRNRLCETLRKRNVFMSNNTPYQRYVDQGYFKVVVKTIHAGESPINYPQTLVSPRGLEFLHKVLYGNRAVAI